MAVTTLPDIKGDLGSQRTIATLIYRDGPISQPELGKRVRLTRSAVNKAITILRDHRLIRTVGTERLPRGRPADVFEVDRTVNLVGVITLDPHELSTRASLIRMDGQVVWDEIFAHGRMVDTEALREVFVTAATAMRDLASQMELPLRSVVVVLSGKMDPSTGALETTVHFPNVANLPVEQIVREITGCHTFSIAEMQALCAGVVTAQEKPSRVAILIWGGGITWSPASPVEPYGQMLSHWRGFGHIQVVRNGQPCYCGGHGCIEAEIGGWSLIKQMQAQYPEFAQLDLRGLRELAKDGHPVIEKLLAQAAERLGEYYSYLCQMSNPDSIIIQTGLGLSGEILIPAFRRGLEPWLHPVRQGTTQISMIDDFGPIAFRGAAWLAAELFFNPNMIRRMRPMGPNHVVKPYARTSSRKR